MYTGLTKDVCEKALLVVEPAILAASARGIIKRDHGCLVVCDPTIPQEPKYGPDAVFEREVILFKREFGPKKDWEHNYDLIAFSKAFISWKTGLPSLQVQTAAPFLYQAGMTKHGGSATENGLVVAFSGVEQHYDQMISEMMLAAIKGICIHEMFKPDGVMATADIDYIGG